MSFADFYLFATTILVALIWPAVILLVWVLVIDRETGGRGRYYAGKRRRTRPRHRRPRWWNWDWLRVRLKAG